MKYLATLLLLSLTFLHAEPTSSRTWTSQAGTSFKGRAIELSGSEVSLVDESGKKIRVSLKQLVEADALFLRQHFGDKPIELKPLDLPIPQGTLSGPIKVDKDSADSRWKCACEFSWKKR